MDSSPSDRTVVVAGPDRGLVAAFEAVGAKVTHIEGMITTERLMAAGIEGADIFVLTDPDEATAIPIAREANPEVRILAYTAESLPEFAVAGLERALDPALFEPATIAEELVVRPHQDS